MWVRWAGLDVSGDTREPLDNLTNCEEAVAAFGRATGRSPPRRAPPPAAAAAPPPIPPAGFTVDLAPPGDLRAALVGRTILYRDWWPEDGWQRGTVARLCPRGAFSDVVAYTRQTSALRGKADTLLDAASYGAARWVLLSPAPGAGVARPADSAAPARRSGRAPRADPDFQFGRWLVTAWASGPARAGGSCGNCHHRMFCDSSVGLSDAAEDSRSSVATARLSYKERLLETLREK